MASAAASTSPSSPSGGQLKSLPATAHKLLEDELRVSARREQLASGRKLTLSTPRNGAVLLESVSPELLGIADSLVAWAHSLKTENHAASKALTYHAESLKRICGGSGSEEPEEAPELQRNLSENRGSLTVPLPSSVGRRGSKKPTVGSQEDDSFLKLIERQNTRQLSMDEVSFREKAACVLERGGRRGEPVNDLVEVPVAEIKDKLAISYWRFCEGLRLYRSPVVTEAMRLICSAAVPGLGGTNYLEVFDTLTQSTAWEQHIYIFGGLVRDVLRRTVGNDIDIGFSAPAAELEAVCNKAGYQNQVDGDYIIIGDENGEEYLEGMVISFNGIQPPEHADFSMNTLFYDFRNDVVVDKTGKGVPAVLANRLELPCPSDRWKSWIEINGVRVCFRFYKFLLKGYDYNDDEMQYVVETLLDFWRRDVQHTIDVGRVALGSLIKASKPEQIEQLRELVFKSFDAAKAQETGASRRMRFGRACSLDESVICRYAAEPELSFLSARSWWEKGWLVLLEKPQPE